MNNAQQSRLTQSYLGLSDKDFAAVPGLERALGDTINSYIDSHHVTMGTAMTALTCIIGEYILMNGDESDAAKKWFLGILDAYISTGADGARIGPDSEPSLVRRFRPWRGEKKQ